MSCEHCVDKSYPPNETNTTYITCGQCGLDLAKLKQRTSNQNRALWKYLTELANDLNGAGVDQKMFIDQLKGWEIPITKEFLHHIWLLKQGKMFPGQTSTTQMQTDQVTQVYDALNNFTGTTFGVSMTFPSSDTIGE